MNDVYATTELLSTLGVQKSKLRIDHLIIKSSLAGVFLSFSGLLFIIIGGGSGPLCQSLGLGIQRMIQATSFPIGLVLIIMTGSELFSSNTMVFVISTLHRKTKLLDLIISWTVSYFGNLAGCLFYEGILVYYAGILSNDPYRSFVVSMAEVKGNTPWHQLFLRGIGGNWLLCLAVWLVITGRELHSKVFGAFLPIWLFVTVGYEHSIANMFTVQIGMMLGADLSVGKYISCVMIPVTLGNIIGGALFAGLTFWYLYIPEKINDAKDNDIDVLKSSISTVDSIVEKQKERNQSEEDRNIYFSF